METAAKQVTRLSVRARRELAPFIVFDARRLQGGLEGAVAG